MQTNKKYDSLSLERERRNILKSFTITILERAVKRNFPQGKNLRRDNFFLHQGIRERPL